MSANVSKAERNVRIHRLLLLHHHCRLPHPCCVGSSSSPTAAVRREALNEHADVVADLLGRVSSDLRRGFAPAVESFLGFFHAVDWTEHTTHFLLPSATSAVAPHSAPAAPCAYAYDCYKCGCLSH
ncbi:hypothetical protein ABZP36_017082 [Zizania latifolia]